MTDLAVLIWTNETHHLVWTHVWIDRSVQFKLGPVHWAAIVYALILSLGHLAAMGWLFVRSLRHRWIAAGLFVAPLLSRLGGVLNVSGLNPFEPLNPMMLTLNITLIPYALVLFLGMFLNLGTSHNVTSNREVGLGRYDIALVPKAPGRRGIVIELKKAGKKDKLKTRAKEALEQAHAREYRTALEQAKASPMVMVGIALRGKETAVCWEEIECKASALLGS